MDYLQNLFSTFLKSLAEGNITVGGALQLFVFAVALFLLLRSLIAAFRHILQSRRNYRDVLTPSYLIGLLFLTLLLVGPLYVDSLEFYRKNELDEAIKKWGITNEKTVALVVEDFRLSQRRVELTADDIERLGSTNSLVAIQPLITVATSPKQHDLRPLALDQLSQFPRLELIPYLSSAFDLYRSNDDAEEVLVRHRSLLEEIVVASGDQGIDLLGSSRPEGISGRKEVASLLFKIGTEQDDEHAIDVLIRIAKGESCKYTGCAALMALAALNSSQADQVLINAATSTIFSDEHRARRRAAVFALARQNREHAKKILLELLGNETDREGQLLAIVASGESGSSDLSSHVSPFLTDWTAGARAARALQKMGWTPSSGIEEVHFWVASRNGAKLRSNWPRTSEMLYRDIRSNDRKIVENAVNAFIGIGFSEELPKLIAILDDAGNKTMAEVYLNSGSRELSEAARYWAERHGFDVEIGRGANPVSWGAF